MLFSGLFDLFLQRYNTFATFPSSFLAQFCPKKEQERGKYEHVESVGGRSCSFRVLDARWGRLPPIPPSKRKHEQMLGISKPFTIFAAELLNF